MKRRLGALVALGCASSGASVALAEAAQARSESEIVLDLFDSIDTTDDGAVDRGEIVGFVQRHVERRVRERFSQLDRDRDGRVVRREVGRMDARRFARFDLNQDGAFTQTELARVMRDQCEARMERVLLALDANGDGRWTRMELTEPPTDERLAARGGEEQGE